MKRISIRSLVLLVGLTAAMSAQADTWTADFSSSSLDPRLTLSATSLNWTVTSGNGVLDFSSPGNSTASTSRNVRYSELLSGDFTATVTVDVSQGYNVIGFLNFFGPSGSLLTTNIDAYKFNFPGDSAHIGGFNPVTNSFPPNLHGLPSVLTLQINRTGDLFTESYKTPADSVFTPFFSFDGSAWHGVGGRLSLSARQETPAAVSANVRFSNFTVTTPVPEPGTWAMLLAGLAAMSTVARRRARNLRALI
jgi:hypothetical protein